LFSAYGDKQYEEMISILKPAQQFDLTRPREPAREKNRQICKTGSGSHRGDAKAIQQAATRLPKRDSHLRSSI
jgi:hypothetical protein